MANITMDSLKIALQSVLAAVTRHKPNLSVTDPDDPRFVVGAEEMRENVSKAQEAADEAQTTATNAQSTATAAQETATAAQEIAAEAVKTVNKVAPGEDGNVFLHIADVVARETAIMPQSNVAGISFEHSNVTDNYAYDIAYANGLWQVGMYNAAYYSADGKEWTKNETVTDSFSGFTYADGLWVVGGYAGIYYSEDGKTWMQSNVTDKKIRKTAYANGVWVAGGNLAGLYYSKDGKNWTASNVTSGTYSFIVYGGGLWIAGGTTYVYCSTDGVTWTYATLMAMKSLAYGDGVWLSYASPAGLSPDMGLYYSNDGANWRKVGYRGAFVAYANGMWMHSRGTSGLFYSYDGKSWTRTNIEKCTFNDISYGNGLWVAAADNANGTAGLYYSLDGKVWEQTNVAEGALAHVAYADGMWVAAADSGTGGSTGLYYGEVKAKYATADDLSKAKDAIGKVEEAAETAKTSAADAKENAEAIGAAGADWNQDDSTALDYIKNRTHYTVPPTVLSGFTNKLTDGTFDGSSCIVIGDAFDAKKLIGAKIRYAGDEVILTEEQIYPLAGSYTNVAIAVSSPQSKELPGLFVISGAPTNGTFVTDSGTKAYQFGRTGLYRMDGFYTVPSSLEIEYGGEVVPLDEKYLPASVTEGIATVQEIAEEAKSAADEAKATADAKMDATNPAGSGSLSIGRAVGTPVGDNSSAVGKDVTASGANSHAEGKGALTKYKVTGEAGATTYTLIDYDTGEPTNTSTLAFIRGWCIRYEGVVATIAGMPSGDNYSIITSKTLSSKALTKADVVVYSSACGASSHVEGEETNASGQGAHAEGYTTVASGKYSHAEGFGTTASGKYSHAEGTATASGDYSHAEGEGSRASGRGSHAESGGMASGECSHAEGLYSTAEGQYAHAEGCQTSSKRRSQHVQGEWNIVDNYGEDGTARGKYAHIVGNGTSFSKRSNAHTLDWDGNAWFAGTVEGTAAILKSTTEGSEKRITITADDNLRLTATDEDGNTRTFGTGYKLIETITLDEDMAIVRTEEPDGTPYNFTAVAIRVKKAEGITVGETYLTAHIGESKTQPLYMPQTSSTTEQWIYCEVYQYRGLWGRERAQGWSVKNNAETPYQVKLPSFDIPVANGENIVKISGASVPAGLTIEIWGERA